MNNILIDSSFLYAIYDLDDKYHDRASEFSEQDKNILIVPDIVLTEVAYLLRRSVGQRGVVAFLDGILLPPLRLEPLFETDIRRAREIMTTYADAKLDFVDCSIMAIAERLQITDVCTFDRRDFSIFEPKHCDYLELLP